MGASEAACGMHATSLWFSALFTRPRRNWVNKGGVVRRLRVISGSIVSEEGTQRQRNTASASFSGSFVERARSLVKRGLSGGVWGIRRLRIVFGVVYGQRGGEAACGVYSASVVFEVVCETAQGLEVVGG